MDKREVTIRYDSYMYDTDEHIEMIANGAYYEKCDKHYVMYTEELENGQPVKNVLKFDDRALEVLKFGVTKTKMYYEPGYTHTDVYRTAFGDYDMCIDTDKYILVLSEDHFKILTEYRLKLGGSHVSKCKVEIYIDMV